MPGGISITAFGVQAVMDAQPDFGAVQGDIKNAFNEIQRESIMEAMKGEIGLSSTLAFSHVLLNPITYIGMGSCANVVTAPFKSEEGSQQWAIKVGWFFALGANAAFQRLNDTLHPSSGVVMAIMDNNYTLSPPGVNFDTTQQLSADLAVVGLELQPAKSCCYIADEFRSNNWDTLRGAIPEGVLMDNGEPVLVDGGHMYGVSVCNVPIGTLQFLTGYLWQRLSTIWKGFDKATSLLDPGRWLHLEIPSRQML